MSYLLLLSTICCTAEIFASMIITFIISRCFSESSEDKAVRNEIVTLKKEMSNISMVDEFSKYAKLQRKYNTLKSEAKDSLNARLASKAKLRLTLIYGFQIVNKIFTAIFVYWNLKEPVIYFPNGSLWPIGSYLSWPTNQPNCISLSVWIILMKLSVSACQRLISV